MAGMDFGSGGTISKSANKAFKAQLTKVYAWYTGGFIAFVIVLAIGFVVTFVMAYFARDLSSITFFGWPLSFYMAAQGSLIVYVVIIAVYARTMNRLDQEHGVAEEE